MLHTLVHDEILRNISASVWCHFCTKRSLAERVVELATTSVVYREKVAACELLDAASHAPIPGWAGAGAARIAAGADGVALRLEFGSGGLPEALVRGSAGARMPRARRMVLKVGPLLNRGSAGGARMRARRRTDVCVHAACTGSTPPHG